MTDCALIPAASVKACTLAEGATPNISSKRGPPTCTAWPAYVAWTPRPELEIDLDHAWELALFDGGPNDGEQINNVPRHILRLAGAWQHARFGTIAFWATHVREQWLDEANRHEMPDYTTVDASVSRSWAGVDVQLQVQNLFDARYAPAAYLTMDETGAELPLYFPAAGRTWRIGVRAE